MKARTDSKVTCVFFTVNVCLLKDYFFSLCHNHSHAPEWLANETSRSVQTCNSSQFRFVKKRTDSKNTKEYSAKVANARHFVSTELVRVFTIAVNLKVFFWFSFECDSCLFLLFHHHEPLTQLVAIAKMNLNSRLVA